MARKPNPDREINRSLSDIVGKLSKMDDGDEVTIDFLSTRAVSQFCKMIGFRKSWAGRSIDDICIKTKPDYGPKVVQAEDARIVLNLVQRLIQKGLFVSRDGTPFDKTILNDFLPAGKRFAGEATLGHFWEFQYALQVELEHGRTRGTNVTNNHPLLTAFVVMAHLTEDKVYYARLWVTESEGELTNAVLEKKKADEIASIAKQHVRAKAYLGKRLAEKAKDFDLPK